ncbi:MAG TPA: DUF3943 domain-containing protein [Gemmatimonadales bacterium]|nr:DUF3943 domain-containing protein [Gemmatimonadales bacterium]
MKKTLLVLALVSASVPGVAAQARPRSGVRQLPCPDCNPPKRFWPGFGEVMVVQFIPWSVNSVLRDAEWAKIGPSVWATNIENPWVWDNNHFLNNQFSHPYHGSLYFNAGRANGYNFWESVPWAFGGSLMWEWFFEGWAPAPNDWLNTSLGGIALGEMLFKVSSLTLDNTESGSERMWREIGATALNPVRGFNRLVRGEMNDISANPPDWRPSRIFASFDAGYRSATGGDNLGNEGSTGVGFLQATLFYGDQVEDLGKAPFSAFNVGFEIATEKQGERGRFARLMARGNLGARELGRGANSSHRLALFMSYEFLSTESVEFGGQGFQGGLVSRWGDPKGFRIQSEILGAAYPIVATQSDYFVSLEGRDYDYGLGFGGNFRASAIWEGLGAIDVRARMLWEPVLSGFNGDHYQYSASLEGRLYARGRLGVGASVTTYHRKSVYDAFPDVSADGTQIRAYASYAVPRWHP